MALRHVLQELAAKRKKSGGAVRRWITRCPAWSSSYGDGHTFNVPGLGVTMADGGEELKKKEER